MMIKEEEWFILRDLIGKNVKSILIPTSDNGELPQKEACLVLSNDRGILIDSCPREQRAVETPVNYPQIRVRKVNVIPSYPWQEKIELGDYGEIVRSVEVTNEELIAPDEIAAYTKTVHLTFSGNREVTITRESFRSPALWVFEQNQPCCLCQEENPYIKTVILRA